MTDTDTDRTTRQIADHLEITNLIARVAQGTDAGDLDDYEKLWTEDAAWEFPGAPKFGRANIMQGARGRRAAGDTGPGSATRHVITTLAVSVLDESQAEADSYWLFYGETTGTPTLRLMGHYHDTLRRGPDGWQLARRQVTLG